MGMAKKRIFNSQSIFFCQLGVINKLFVFRAFQDKFFWGGGGGGGGKESVFNILSLHSFFPFVVLFYSPFCCPLYCLSFVWSFGWLPFFRKRAKSSR